MKVSREIISKIYNKRKGKFAIWVICISLFLALFSNFIANERPHIARIDGQLYFPILHELGEQFGICRGYSFIHGKSWKEITYEMKVQAPVSYSPARISVDNLPYQSPLSFSTQDGARHWLGTDGIGRDVAAIIIHGYKYAIWVGLFSLAIALIAGIFIGACMGYYGDDGLQFGLFQMIFCIIVIVIFTFYTVHLQWTNSLLGWIMIIVGILGILYAGSKLAPTRITSEYSFPLDLMMMRIIEMFRAIPNIFILLALMSLITKPNIGYVILIIGLLKWPQIARLMRGEILNIRQVEYIQAAKTYGQREYKILFLHALPNAIGPVLIVVAFGISSAILLEATISFLGIGVNPEQITWGHLLSNARGNFNAWWLALFPGMALFILILALNFLGDCVADILNPRRSISLS